MISTIEVLALGYSSTGDWVRERIGGYIKLSVAERRDALLELKSEVHSNREVAEILGAAEGTVRNAGQGR
jgi:DNA-binding CsgD family transcriptional regulator